MDDLSLVKDILQGNADSFNVLIYRYEYHIYNFIYKNINNIEAARDVTQEVFIAVYNKLYTYKGEYKFSTWLFKIARNKCVDYARKHKRYIEVDLESAGDMVSREISPEQYIELSETKRALQSCIGELDDTDRQILILRYLNDKITFNDISDILGINLSTVKTKYYRMLERLKSQLSEETGRCRR